MALRTLQSVFVDETTRFDVKASTLVQAEAGRYNAYVSLWAWPNPDPPVESGVNLIIEITDRLLANTPFRGRNDIESILTELGLVLLKKALRDDTAARKLQCSLGSDNWEHFIKFNPSGSGFSIIDTMNTAFVDRQIAKRLIMRHLWENAVNQSIGDIHEDLGLEMNSLRTFLQQLEKKNYIHHAGENWCISQEGERIANMNLKDEFPMDPSAIPAPAIGNGMVINVNQSQVGILNAGQIENLNNNILNLKQGDGAKVAAAFEAILKAVSEAQDLTEQNKREALEIVENLSSEATKLPAQRATGFIKVGLMALATTLSAAGGLAEVWKTWGPPIAAFFGISL